MAIDFFKNTKFSSSASEPIKPIFENLASSLKKKPVFDIQSIISKLTTKLSSPIKPEVITNKLVSKIPVPQISITPQKPVLKTTFADVAQLPSAILGKFYIEPTFNMLSSIKELATGKPLPKLNISGLTKNFGSYVDGSSYQQKYTDAIASGMPEKEAYRNVLTQGLNDALILGGPVKSATKLAITKVSPTSLITPKVTNISKTQFYDYFSGRKTAQQIGLTSQNKTLITETMKSMSTQEKAQFLQGFDLLEAKPSTLGKLFGVTEQEAKNILNQTYGTVRQSAVGALPGTRARPGQAPAFGLSLKEVEQVGKVEKGISSELSLTTEARKYKSADEFVKGQEPLYRGGQKLDLTRINEEGLPLTKDNKIAEQFARIKNQFDESPTGQILGKQKGSNFVETYYLKPDTKIASRADVPDDIFNAYKNANPLTKPNIAEPIINKWAKENRFDAIDYRTLGKTSAKEAEIKILNPEKLLTKSQLEEIWNKAQGDTKINKTDLLNQALERAKAGEDFGVREERISTIDRLIAQDKVRIVSRDNVDTLQIKKEDKWITVPDEATAIKEIESIPRVSTKLSEEGIPLGLNKRERAIIEGKIQPGEKLPKEEKIKKIKKESIESKINNKEEAKSAFNAFDMDPFEDEVRTRIHKDVFGDIERMAKVGSSMFKPVSAPNLIDVYRNMKSFFGNYYPTIKRTVMDPFDASKGAYVDMNKRLAEELHKEVVVKLGIKPRSKESEAVMDYGERNLKDEFAPSNPQTEHTLIADFGPVKAKKIMEADAYFRKQYNELIDWVNVEKKQIYGAVWERKRLLDDEISLLKSRIQDKKSLLESKTRTNTLAYLKVQSQLRSLNRLYQTRKNLIESDLWWRGKIVPKRNDYYRHYQEMTEGFKALGNILTQDANIPTKLAGISSDTKPKSKFLQFAQARTGNKSNRDAIGSFLDYIPAASYSIHIDPHIEGFRKIAESLRYSENKAYSPMIEYLTDFANDLAGKTNEIDRGIQKVTGRKVFRVINWFNNRVKANVILGNISSSMAQIFNVPQGIGSAKQYSINGAARSFTQIFRQNIPMQQSSFIKERFAKDITKQFDTRLINKPKEFALWMLTALDEVGTKFIWNSHYEKAIAQKINNPIKWADDMTRRLIAGRGIGEVPLIQKSKMFQLIAPFQLEVGNAWLVMKDFVSEKDFGGLVLFFVTAFLMNEGAEKIRGSNVVFDPIQALIEGAKAFKEDENKLRGGVKLGGRVIGEVVSNIPLGQTMAGLYPEYGYGKGDWAISREELFGKGDPTRFGSGLLAMKGLQDPLFKVLTPFGGAQIKKTIEGIMTLKEGGVFSKSGQLKYLAPTSILGKFQTLAFGKGSGPSAKQYFEQEEVSKTEKSEIKPIYDKAQELLKQGKKEEATAFVNQLSSKQKEVYKKYKTQIKTQETIQGKKEIVPFYLEMQELKKTNLEEAKQKVNALPDDQKRYYKLVKEQIDKDNKASDGIEPSFKDGETQTTSGLINTVFTYAKAIGTDPVTAFDRIFTGQRIRYVSSGAIVVERMPLSESQNVKEKLGGNTKDFKLDHLVPLQLGGSNSEDNLVLVPTDKWASYTPVENYLGKKLRNGTMNKQQVQDLIIKFKSGILTSSEIIKD